MTPDWVEPGIQQSRTGLAPPEHSGGPCPYTEMLVGYVIGVLDDAEREIAGAHLENCPRCQCVALALEEALDASLDAGQKGG